ncbi:MAG: CoF synthetase [Planctomycetota bacterium]|nr:MAG: CoF synthetase [Planctomycetota bacterium]
MINRIVVEVLRLVLMVCRLPVLRSPRVYALLGTAWAQPLLEHWGRRRAVDVHRVAARRCPAYGAFLRAQGAPVSRGIAGFGSVPITTKSNYVLEHSIESRCLGGKIPARGVVIDESSGSSGEPNNWVRGRAEREAVRRLLRHGLALTYRGESLFLLNCFALGPWATGMNLSMSLADSVILKSIGPDRAKLESTLRRFGPGYRYAVAGYPPFIKDWMDSTGLDLSGYEMHLIVGGEGISEGLRDRFLRVFRSVRSSYGASDLEINIAAETPLSIRVRRLCAERPGLCAALFGTETPPMVFQYNPLDYLVERSPAGELVITLLRRGNVAPKVRYNIMDLGGSVTHRAMVRALGAHGVDVASLPSPSLAFPFLFVCGRSDLSVAFYGAKIRTSDLDAVLNNDPVLREVFHSYQMSVERDERLDPVLRVMLERSRGSAAETPGGLSERLYEAIAAVNQDFREVTRMFGPERIVVEVFAFGEGPFAARDIRVKQRYIGGED